MIDTDADAFARALLAAVAFVAHQRETQEEPPPPPERTLDPAARWRMWTGPGTCTDLLTFESLIRTAHRSTP